MPAYSNHANWQCLLLSTHIGASTACTMAGSHVQILLTLPWFVAGTAQHVLLQEPVGAAGLAHAMYEAPYLAGLLMPQSAHALLSCNRQLRHVVHSLARKIHLDDVSNVNQVVSSDWPQLLVILSFTSATSLCPEWPAKGSLECLGRVSLSAANVGRTAFVVRPEQQQSNNSVPTSHISTALAFLSKHDWTHYNSLTLADSILGMGAMTHLLAIVLPNLTVLDISDSMLDASALAHLAMGAWPMLKKLSLKASISTQDAVETLVQGQWPLLETLDMTRDAGPVMPIQTATFCASIAAKWPQLCRLGFTGATFGSYAIPQVTYTFHDRLESLTLSNAGLTAAALWNLISPTWPRLRELDLSGNQLQADAAQALCLGHMQCLQWLDLHDNQLDARAMECLTMCSLPQLQKLDLVCSCLDEHAMFYLCKGAWPHLSCLHLHGNNINAAGFTLLAWSNWHRSFYISMNWEAAFEVHMAGGTASLLDVYLVADHYAIAFRRMSIGRKELRMM